MTDKPKKMSLNDLLAKRSPESLARIDEMFQEISLEVKTKKLEMMSFDELLAKESPESLAEIDKMYQEMVSEINKSQQIDDKKSLNLD